VRAEAERETARVEVREGFEGDARVAGYTVIHGADGPTHTVMLCDTGDGARAVAVEEDLDLAETATTSEIIGRDVRIGAEGATLLG
jgi:hypothetical protein